MTRILGTVAGAGRRGRLGRLGRDTMGLLLILAIMVITSGCQGQEGQEGEEEEEVLYYEDIESQEIRDNWESYPLGIKNQEKTKQMISLINRYVDNLQPNTTHAYSPT